ncbi:isochorismatase family protein [Aestuariibacter salexigens]|uniref:isochorismatase family protein n=1 Tax=Aestuariibacter salexigens TaxID=226010 RepID=UPI0004260DAC|nr:isochorismatase family protein [Aestuariibacter salexigens]
MDLNTGDIGLGQRPALILVDLSVGFTSPSSPLGGVFDETVSANQSLLKWFRKQGFPVFFTTVIYDNPQQASVFRQRLPDLNILERDSKWVNIDRRVAPIDGEQIIEKCWASAFFATDLADKLKACQADSLVISGLTTSGCVRATAVDGLQHNYPVVVVREACGDRNLMAHHANLHDINAKYGKVVSLDSIVGS